MIEPRELSGKSESPCRILARPQVVEQGLKKARMGSRDPELPISRLALRVRRQRVTKMRSLVRVDHKMPAASLFQAGPAQGAL